MTRAVLRKAFADVRSRPLQSALLFLVVAAAATTLSLALTVQASAARPYDRLREATDGADRWVNVYGGQADFEALRQLPAVEHITGPYPVSYTNFGIRNGDTKQQFALVGRPRELPERDRPLVTEGRWWQAADEMVLDRGAARRLDLEPGDRVELLTPTGPEPFTVVGLAVSAGRAPPPITDPAFAYVSAETMRRLEPEATFGADIRWTLMAGLHLKEGTENEQFLRQAFPALGPAGIISAASVRETIESANQFDVIFLNIFSVFSLIASGMILANAVGGQVLSQLRDIGILKAFGFTPRQVTLSLLAQNLALGLAAGLTGVGAGLLLAPFFLSRTADILGVPASAAFDPALAAVTIAVVAAIVTLFTLVPAWRAGGVSAIEALTAGNDAGPARPSRLTALANMLRLPRAEAVSWKDLSRRPMRTVMTVAALVMAVVTATFSLGIEATFDKTMSDVSVIGGPPYDIGSDRDALPDAEARRILDSLAEVEGYLAVYNLGGRIDRYSFDLVAYEGDLNEPRWAVREGRMPSAAGEAAVSTLLARELGLRVGDTVTVEAGHPAEEPRPVRVTIVGRYVDFEGEVMTVTRATTDRAEGPDDYLIDSRPGTDNHALADKLVQLSGGYLDPEVYTDTIADVRDDWRPVIFGLNGVLFAIAGVNLLSSMLLSIRERRRDFAVLKAVGFTPGQVARSVVFGSASLAVVALAIGLPLGLVATRVMFDVLSSAAGIGTGVGAMPGPLWLAPLVPGAIAVAALGSLLPARRAAGIRVAEALRHE